ncbi:MAG: alpha/beta hydrolase [Candidatus Calescibacterium sp.]|nr:alpha/beta hydrolase [Candidatus Calescibacterium sp.]MCX7734885.1 alpha/beta hydrolase [bacterium]MDW8086576.1 alpha/beta fold hydrolase [Candidatus Calescibacterium sp.]
MQIHYVSAPDEVRLGILEWKPDNQNYKYPILLIHGFAQNNLSWHGRNGGIAPTLCSKGFHVFCLDLRGSGYSRLRKLYYDYTFDDFVFKDMESAFLFITTRTGVDKIVLGGHSLGGICSYAYSAFFPQKVQTVITFGSPVHFGRGVQTIQLLGRLASFMKKVPFSHLIYYFWPREFGMKLMGMFGLVGVPLMMNRRILKFSPLYPSYTRNFESAWDFWEKLVGGFEFTSPRLLVQLLLWSAQRKITSFDGSINYTEKFKNITSPLFALSGILDKVAPPKSVKPIVDIVSSKVKEYKEYVAGHIDLVEGKLAKGKISDDVEKFLRESIF